jgi:dihydrofolate reductase
VAEAPNLFQFDSFDDELGALLGRTMADVDTVLMGRTGYQEWAGYWPTAPHDQDFGAFINDVPKFVASRTLKPSDVNWNNAKLIEGDLESFVRDLKNREGGTVAAMAGMSVVRQLLLAGLMDELTLIVHPVIAGTGRHLFTEETPMTRLALITSEKTSKGNVVLTYARRT